MRIAEIVDGQASQLTALKQQAKQARKRAQEAALRDRLRKTQQAIANLNQAG